MIARGGGAPLISHDLPPSLTCGTSPALQAGGDGVEVADLRWLRELLLVYPHIKFLVSGR